MDIIRVTDANGALTCVRFGSDAIGYRSLIRLLRRLPGIDSVHARNGWPFSGDVAARFTIRHQEFVIDSPFSDYCLQPVNPNCPAGVFADVADFLEEERITWLKHLL